MKEFASKYLSQKTRNIVSLFIIVVGVFFIYTYTLKRPTQINKMIAARLYYDGNTPNSAFTDINFYNCIADNLGVAHTDSLSDEQLASITELNCDEKNISNITGIEKLTNLTSLSMERNQLTTASFGSNTKLVTLSLANNQLTSINIETLSKLENLNLSDNNISTLNIRNNDALTDLNAHNNKLGNIEIGYNRNLTNLDLSNNPIKNIANIADSIGYNTKAGIKKLSIYEIQLTDGTYNLSAFTGLEELDISGNKITTLDLTANSNLKYIIARPTVAEPTKLSSLDISGLTKLETIEIAGNSLTSLDVSTNSAIVTIYAANNNLTTFTTKSNTNTKLKTLSLTNNKLTELNVPSSVTYVDASKNKLTSVTTPAGVTTLNLANNSIETLTTPTNVKWLDISKNRLTSLKISGNSKLERLIANGNTNLSTITTHTSGTNLPLKIIDVRNCSLTSINLKYYTNLEELYASNNQLTSIDLSKNTKLTNINIKDNDFGSKEYIYLNDEYMYNYDGIILPDGKDITLESIVLSTGEEDTGIETGVNISKNSDDKIVITGLKNGEYSFVATYSHTIHNGTSSYVPPSYLNTTPAEGNAKFSVTLDLDVVEATIKEGTNNYKLDNEKGYIYTWKDIASDTIIGNIDLSTEEASGVVTTATVTGGGTVKYPTKYAVKVGTKTLKEFDIISIKAKSNPAKYPLDEYDKKEKYIYYINNTSAIIDSILPINATLTIESNKLLIKNSTDTSIVVDEYILSGISLGDNSLNDLTRDYIYYSESGGVKKGDIVNEITAVNAKAVVDDDKLYIKYKNENGKVIGSYDLIGTHSTKYDLHNNYIFYGTANIDDVTANITVDSGLTATRSNDKLAIKKGTTVISNIILLGVQVKTYTMRGNTIYVSSDYGNDTAIKANIVLTTPSTNKSYTATVNGNKLTIAYDGTTVHEYKLAQIVDYIQLDPSGTTYQVVGNQLRVNSKTTTVKNIIDSIEASSNAVIEIRDKSNKKVADTSTIKTGYVLKAFFDNEDEGNNIEYKIVLKGDVLGEGTISKNGIKAAANHLINTRTIILKDEYADAADMNGDGYIKINDITLMIKELNK